MLPGFKKKHVIFVTTRHKHIVHGNLDILHMYSTFVTKLYVAVVLYVLWTYVKQARINYE